MREEQWLETVLTTLTNCPDRQRTVYLLAVGLTEDGSPREPLPFYEIATLLGISKQAVRFRFIEADAKVSKALFKQALSMLTMSSTT